MIIQFPKNSCLFLTGGTGFFGKCLLRTIAQLNDTENLNCEVVVLSRHPDQFRRNYPSLANHAWLSFVQGDIESFEYRPDTQFTHMIHAATDTSASSIENPIRWFDQIVGGTRHALEFALTRKIPKFLLTSSGAVYGPQPADVDNVPETYLGAPDISDINSTYGIAKRAAEQLCTIYYHQYGIETKVARCFAFVGEYLSLDGHFAIGNLIRDALHSDAIRVKGDGSPLRSYLYGDDLAIWLLTILEKGTPSYPYNVGSDVTVSIAELANIVRDVVAPEKRVIIEKSRSDYGPRSRYVPDISRARDGLALDAWTTLHDAIRRTAQYARQSR